MKLVLAYVAVVLAIAAPSSGTFGWWKNKHGGILGSILPSIKIGQGHTLPVHKQPPQQGKPPQVQIEAEWVCQSTRTGEVVYIPPQQQQQQQPNYPPPQEQPNYPPPQQQPNYPPPQEQPNYPPPQQPNYPPPQEQPNYPPAQGQMGYQPEEYYPPVQPVYPPQEQPSEQKVGDGRQQNANEVQPGLFPPPNDSTGGGFHVVDDGPTPVSDVNTNGKGLIDIRLGDEKQTRMKKSSA